MGRIRTQLIALPVLLAAALSFMLPSGAAAKIEPANLMVDMGAKSGFIKELGDGRYRITLKLDRARAKIKSVENAGLLENDPVALTQAPAEYFAAWNRSFATKSRAAALILKGKGDVHSLRLSNPRFSKKKLTVVLVGRGTTPGGGLFERLRGRISEPGAGAFGPAVLKINDNQWYKFSAHINAYEDYGHCDGYYKDAEFSCNGTGEGGTSTFRRSAGFGSTRGGMDMYMAGVGRLAWGESYLEQYAQLLGYTDWGWSDKFYVEPSSRYYIDFPKSWREKCERHPSSGKDPSLTGQPGGPLRIVLGDAGLLWNTGYVLDAQGYLSETPYVNNKCG